MLLFSGKMIDIHRDGTKLIREYHFQNMDPIIYSQKMHVASDLQPLKGHVRLTREPCCVTDEDDPSVWRAQLACGHSVGQSSTFSSSDSVETKHHVGLYIFFLSLIHI